MHTIKKIIDNQKAYRKEILNFLNEELKNTKKNLTEIKNEDEYIKSQVKKLKNKFKKIKHKKEVDRLFFLHPKRNEHFYAWWDKENEEVLILNYGKN